MDIGLKKDSNSVDPDEGYLLTEKQYKCIEMLISGEYSHTQIAKEIGVHRVTIGRWLKDSRFMAEMQDLVSENKRQTQNYIDSKALLAAKKLWALANGNDKRVSVEILRDWLNRSLGKPTGKIEVEEKQTSDNDFDFNKAIKEITTDNTPEPLVFKEVS